MSDPANDLARQRARLLARLNHDLRAPLARIAARAHAAGAADPVDPGCAFALGDIAAVARRQLAWLGDLQACARYEVAPPELAPAPAYLHALVRAHAVRHDPAALPALAVLDARRLAQVLERLAAHAGPLALDVGTAAGNVVLAFTAGPPATAPWTDVAATLDPDGADGASSDVVLAPGLMLAAHLVRAMGGRLQQAGAALRCTLVAAPATPDQAMPPAPFAAGAEPPLPFGDGHTVLVLEPHQAMCDYVTEIFDSAGFTLCYDAADPDAARPALVVCSDEEAGDAGAAPRLLHALLPPRRPADFAAVLYQPAPARQLLAVARRLLEEGGALPAPTAPGDRR